jgi:UDP-glucuronate 4-epimerase
LALKVLVTGAAGFIGYHTVQALLNRGDEVIGIDNLNDYYDVDLKHARLEILGQESHFHFMKMDLSDRASIADLFAVQNFQKVVHLAAQAGVRYSLENPFAYLDSNVIGTMTILEGCRHHNVEHLVFASSSSVYGANTTMPFSVTHNVDHPLSIYAATKKSNELMAHSYSDIYNLPVTGLRFFTVYGPFGRPDMALSLFTQRILEGKPIDVFNYGLHRRDFTYIDDIVRGIVGVLDNVAEPDSSWESDAPNPASSRAPYRLYNIGNQQPIELIKYIEVLEKCLGRTAQKNLLPLQPGDVLDTWADVDNLITDIGYRPETPIEEGIKQFVDWYIDYYKIVV